jgi:rhamnulokinase
MEKAYLAIDLGAESGRAILGTIRDGKLALRELHRFPNHPLRLPSGLHWNLLDLWSNVLEGLRRAAALAREERFELVSVGVDTWGVDLGLIGKSGQLLGVPFAYRDERGPSAMEKVVAAVGRRRLYDVTGIQILSINTLFHVAAQYAAEPGLIDNAGRLLFMPDLLHFFLSGVAANEATISSTSQMINPRFGDGLGQWAVDLMQALHIPSHMLGTIVPPGTRLGLLRKDVADLTGAATGTAVTVPAGHDTACAVAATPADPASSWCYTSSGTWSLMGVELGRPLIDEAACLADFTNERGVGGKIRFQRNMTGLWLVQQVRRSLEKEGQSHDYAALTALAERAEPFRTLVDVAHKPLMPIGDDMIDRLRRYARDTSQPEPRDAGELTRCCLESLALASRETIEKLESLTGRGLDVIHIVGGGARNALLNQMIADATGCTVVAGPFEATAAGNVLIQAMGAGDIASPDDIRRVAARSFEPVSYRPHPQADWDAAYRRYQRLIAAGSTATK